MHSISTQRYLRMFVELLIFVLATFALLAFLSVAQAQRTAGGGPTITPPPGAPAPRSALQTPLAQAPTFREYHGVQLGMPRAAVQQKLGVPSSSDDRQDVFNVSSTEMAQVFYGQGQVIAFTVNYLGDPKAPTAQQVFGAPVEVREDGSVYKMVRYEAAGLWIAYTSTPENPPFVTIAVQKIR